jgi:hypothetical protein
MKDNVNEAIGAVSLLALDGIPEILPGMALAPLIIAALERHA